MKERAGALTTLDRVNLGACYVRFQRYEEAVRVLEAGDRQFFLILANLASAYHGMGELKRAIDYQEQALAAWPEVWAGWNGPQLNWYRRVERFYLTLLNERYRETLRNPGRKSFETVDALFPKVRFVDSKGRYAAGTLAPRMRDELPPDASQVVQQLVFWLPWDDRLYWLFAELLNAQGAVGEAFTILDDLVYVRNLSNTPEIFAHRKVLKPAAEVLQAFQKTSSPKTWLFWTAAPRGFLPTGGIGAATHEAGWIASIHAGELLDKNPFVSIPQGAANPVQPGDKAAPSAPATAPANALPDLLQVSVGFGAGVVVGALGLLQIGQWRRRRAAASQKQAIS